jgi:hypothetical protein
MMKKSASKAISQQEEGEPPGTLPSVSREKNRHFPYNFFESPQFC